MAVSAYSQLARIRVRISRQAVTAEDDLTAVQARELAQRLVAYASEIERFLRTVPDAS